jgi:hypothetical protein
MTSAVTRSTLDFFAHATIEQLSATVWLLAIAVLGFVMIEREVLRGASPARLRPALGILDAVGLPLLVVFLMVLAVRFISLA